MNFFYKVLFFMFLANLSFANNIQLSNISVTNNPNDINTKLIKFDISWENSWRRNNQPPNNWDGAWVFFKFKDNDGTWRPIRLTGTDITPSPGSAYEIGYNGQAGMGIFIFRSTAGAGTFTATQFSAGILSYPGTYNIRGFALEMVHVPTGTYYLGDGSTSTVNAFKNSNTGNNAYLVTGNTITRGTASGQLFDPNFPTASGTIPSGFPKGFSSFWLMKYELSIAAYRDFLNTLTYDQQLLHFYLSTPASPIGTPIKATGNENFLEIELPGNTANKIPSQIGCDADNDNIFNESNDGEWNTANIGWEELASYLDWACLRPMTELEFEKACRGPENPTPGEYAWGTSGIATAPYLTTSDNTMNQTISNTVSIGNAIYNATKTSLTMKIRSGIFATAQSNRESSGAGYYGAMELSGNMGEFAVSAASATGLLYTGKHGNGLLTTLGQADENFWPESTIGITGKGGVKNADEISLRISNRLPPNQTFSISGGRGVRDSTL